MVTHAFGNAAGPLSEVRPAVRHWTLPARVLVGFRPAHTDAGDSLCGGIESRRRNTKIYLICDRPGWPLTFTLSADQDADTRHFIPTLEVILLPGKVGRPRKRCRCVVADKGYDSDELRHYCDRHHMKPIIAQRKMQRRPRPALPRGFDKPKYREQNVIERGFGWIKELRRIATRYDKLASSFGAMVCLACIDRCLRADFSYKTLWTRCGQVQPIETPGGRKASATA